MTKYIALLILGLIISLGVSSQEVKGVHQVVPSVELNGYNIKTTISGLEGVDIARVIYLIDETHTYKASPINTFFSDRNEKFIKFYVMAVPSSGEIIIDLGLEVANGGDFAFHVEFQYSKNEEKKKVDLPKIYLGLAEDAGISANEELAVKKELEEFALKEALGQKEKEEAASLKVVEETKAKELVVKKELEEFALKEALEQKEKEEAASLKVVEETKAKELVVKKELEEFALKEALEQKEKEEAASLKVVEETKAKELVVKKELEEFALKEALEQKEKAASLKVVEETKAKELVVKKELEEFALKEASEQKKEIISEKSQLGNSYTIQLLSLSRFSQARLDYYCKKNKLDRYKITKKRSGEWMKITCGEFNSKEEASAQLRYLNNKKGIKGAFVVLKK